MRNLFMAVMSQDVKYIKKLMDDEVDILGYTNVPLHGSGGCDEESQKKNSRLLRENGITEARLVEKRGGVKLSNSTDFNFGKFGKFQERRFTTRPKMYLTCRRLQKLHQGKNEVHELAAYVNIHTSHPALFICTKCLLLLLLLLLLCHHLFATFSQRQLRVSPCRYACSNKFMEKERVTTTQNNYDALNARIKFFACGVCGMLTYVHCTILVPYVQYEYRNPIIHFYISFENCKESVQKERGKGCLFVSRWRRRGGHGDVRFSARTRRRN